MNRLSKWLGLMVLLVSPLLAAEEYDLAYYQAQFDSGNRQQQIQAAGSLEWAGLSDEVLFDAVAEQLERVTSESNSKANQEHGAWLLKALGFSGNEKYRPLLEKYSQKPYSKKLRKYAKQGLSLLTQHQKWNPIINDATGFEPAQPLKVNRLANMMKSDELELQRIAAKRVHFEHLYPDYLLQTLAQQLQRRVPEMDDGKLTIDTYAWMTKALAGSAETLYRPVVEEVAAKAPNKKLRKYAKKYLNYY
ncbi:hypothetical protein SAMN04488540_10343 [Ferrimonas sediminum]|uniref:Uncharacterized protein n=1 Tax=Ferrimonas sediminum TaxID=718193 RepID=A0A1G8N9K4_9GAMM|nr:hypothetical protein [Ferrimonas sediminum]SDI76220.1 hypothetical protein SAMN04488540_10343 [Ferrimonas sediminum]